MTLIRYARPDDAPQLAWLAEKTFRDTFEAVNTAENMALHCQSSYSEAIQAAEIANPKLTTLLVEAAGNLIAFAQLRWGPAPSCVVATAPGEIQRLYVLQDWHGRGLAQTLMNACLAEMKKQGRDVVWLGVWEHNPRAISFYKKFGFVEVGEHIFPLGDDPQRDIIMTRPV